MAVTYDRSNDIITLAAANDEVTDVLEVEGILLSGTAAGASELQDSKGNTLLSASLTTSVLGFYLPLRRRVNGVKATTLATNQKVYVYLRKM